MPPLSLMIKPASGRCNLRCRYCFYADETASREVPDYGMMSEEMLDKVLQKALNEAEGSLTVAFQGGEQELQLMHAPTDVHLAVEAEDGVEIVDNALQEPHRATHGFGPAHPAAQCLLWLAGPGILEGARLHQAQVVNIAPTLAKALRLSLPQAQGRVLKEVFAQ